MDAIVRAIAPNANLRFVAVNNTNTVRDIAKVHGVTGALYQPLAHVIGAAQLLGTQLKGMGAVSVGFESDGVLSHLSADANPFGLVRATLPKAACETSTLLDPSKPLIGNGTLTVERRLSESGKKYRSVVEILSPEIAKSIAFYLEKSEQIRTAIGLGSKFGHDGLSVSGGFMVQILPGETSDEDIQKIEDNIANLPPTDDLFAENPDPEDFLKILCDGLEIEMMSRHEPKHFCPCSREGSARALKSIAKIELEKLIEEGEVLAVNCDYCRAVYEFTPDDLRSFID